jgi:hypothetical protein
MAVQNIVDNIAQARNAAAHGFALDLEGGHHIVGRSGQGVQVNIGHGGYIGWRGAAIQPPDAKRSGCGSIRAKTPGQNGLLRMDTVFRLVKHLGLGTINHPVRYLLAAMRGQAVQKQGILGR